MSPLAAVLAAGLHAAVLAAVLPSCSSSTPPAPPPPPKAQAPEQPVFVQLAEDGTLACDHFYVGIGVMTSVMGRVTDVAHDSPAARAFIREGDVMENRDDFSPDSLPVGTEITLRMTRGDVTTLKKLKVARVCYR